MESSSRAIAMYDRIVIKAEKNLSEKSLALEYQVSTRTIKRIITDINIYIYPRRVKTFTSNKYYKVVNLEEDEMFF